MYVLPNGYNGYNGYNGHDTDDRIKYHSEFIRLLDEYEKTKDKMYYGILDNKIMEGLLYDITHPKEDLFTDKDFEI